MPQLTSMTNALVNARIGELCREGHIWYYAHLADGSYVESNDRPNVAFFVWLELRPADGSAPWQQWAFNPKHSETAQ